MVAPHEREVIIRLILEPDKGKAAQAGAEMRKVLDAVKTQATSAAKATADATTKAADQQVKAVKKVAAEQEKAARAMRQNQAALGKAFKQSVAGAMLLGRSLAMLGATGEKDLEKLLRVLIKIQMVYDSLRGASQVIQGISSVVAARGAMRAGGAVAAGGVAGIAGRAGGAAAVGWGAFGKAAAGGATGVVGVKAAGAVAGAGAGTTIAVGVAALASAITATITAVQTLGDAMKFGFGGGATPGSLSDKIANAEVAVVAWTSRLFGFDFTGAGAVEKGEAEKARRRGGAKLEADYEKTVASLLRQKQSIIQTMRNEELQRVREIQRVELQGGQQRISLLERARDIQIDAARRARQQATGARERFADLNPMARMRVQRAKQKMAAGQRLTVGEEQALGQFREIGSIDRGVGALKAQRADQWGFGDFGGGELQGVAEFHERAARHLQVDLNRQSVEVQVNFVNQETYIREIVRQTKEVFAKNRKQELQDIKQALQQVLVDWRQQEKALHAGD